MKTNIQVPFRFASKCNLAGMLALALLLATVAHAQITPSDDAYVLTTSPTTNYGAKNTLEVESAGATTFVRFDLSSIPPTITGSMVAKATLKIYVGTVTTAGSFNVDLVTSAWSESTVTANTAPTLGSAIASAVPVTKADKNQYVLVDVTAAVVDWLNGTANNGIALVPDGAVSFALNSKETTTTSHPAELDVVFTSGGGGGTITGINTASGSGLIGGGTSGTLNLSLTNTCAANQVLQWNGTAWVCAKLKGSGTITGVTAGTDLTGGGTSGNVTLNLDTTKVPELNAANTFTQPLTVTATVNTGFGTLIANNASQYSNTAAVVGNATYTGTASTIGVEGYSQSSAGWGVYGNGGAAGVYGGSKANGVFGNSTSGNGVYGQTTGGSGAGVSGVNSVSGYGVLGEATGSSGQGVWGESFGSSTANGAGPDGVHGVSHSSSGSGVAGINTAKDAFGVYGSDLQGYGFVTDSHVSQARSMGGWVKAMVYVNHGIQRCFNSTLKGSQATTVPCGITFTYLGSGNSVVDFGFQVDDRFLQATEVLAGVTTTACLDDYCAVNSTQVGVYSNNGNLAPFFLIIF